MLCLAPTPEARPTTNLLKQEKNTTATALRVASSTELDTFFHASRRAHLTHEWDKDGYTTIVASVFEGSVQDIQNTRVRTRWLHNIRVVVVVFVECVIGIARGRGTAFGSARWHRQRLPATPGVILPQATGAAACVALSAAPPTNLYVKININQSTIIAAVRASPLIKVDSLSSRQGIARGLFGRADLNISDVAYRCLAASRTGKEWTRIYII
ncbi:unnamed protein product [Plutella xylostella]|uniref:(diamondback moth) hypothetical protein n=1 Tax=Plutella xylostella TaxID=51655 RepID=A0A8S4E898_PLUXY|nr:unnamed protein product [Plutella xylostella]